MTPPIHQTTRRRWALLLVLPALVGFAIYFFAAQARKEDEWVRHAQLVQLSIERLHFNLDNAETSQRGYLLAGKERFVEPYRSAVAAARREAAHLRDLTADNPRQQQAAAGLEPLLENKLRHMDRNIGLRRAGVLDAATMEDRVDQGQKLMDAVNAAAGAIRGEEERLLAARQIEFRSASAGFTWSLVAGCLIFIAVVGSLYRGVHQYSRRVAAAEQRLGRLNVELEQRVQERTSSVRAREELLKTFVKYVPAAVAMLDSEMRYLQVSDRWCTDYALATRDLLGRSHYEVFPDIPEPWKAIHRRCLAGESRRADEDCWRRADGSTTWLHWEILPWGGREGKPEGLLIFTEDITERKRMEEALRKSEGELRTFAGNLITAQEDERRRIARELHDDVTQQLAFLSIEIGKLAGAPIPGDQAAARLRSLQAQVIQISEEVRRLSHGLHPSVIEDFGLSLALEEFCDEFSRAQSIAVRFEGLIDDTEIGRDASSCLYRVAQESVRNATKHAGATEVRVELSRNGESVQLLVSDNGAGFTPETARANGGLGITSMKERMRIVDGTIEISSQTGHGTQVLAWIPLPGGRHETAGLAG